jgi:hypothetical protein
MNNETEAWKSYSEGIDFKNMVGLFKDVNENIKHYSGDPWEGVQTNGLPVVSLPLVRRIVNHKISIVGGDEVKINYSIDGIDDIKDNNKEKAELQEIARCLSAYAMTLWENLYESDKNNEALLDAALSGDGIEYFAWDPKINAGNGVMGNIVSEIVDNVNYFPGNPNSPDVQSQPDIMLVFRKMVEDLKKEAKENGIQKEEYDNITDDKETENQAGAMAKIELAKTGKCLCFLKMWKVEKYVINYEGGEEQEQVFSSQKEAQAWINKAPEMYINPVIKPVTRVIFNKATRYSRITKGDIDSGLTQYPLAMFNWYLRKNCAHGISEVKGVIPNQMAINKLASMIILAVMHIAIPKLIFNNSFMAAPSNLIGGAIGVSGDVDKVAKYLTPGQLSNDIYKVVDLLIDKTKEMLGATDAALGELNMDNTSALTVLQKASAIPSKPISARFHRFIEDKARIWMDFFIHKYNVNRTLTYIDEGQKRTFEFNGTKYGNLQWRIKVDVGASTHWSEVTAIQTLDNLLMNQHITFVEYLDRLPNGIIPMREKLMQTRTAIDEDRQLLMKLLADKMEQMPPEQRDAVMALPPEQIEAAVRQMVMQEQPAQQTPAL